MGCSGLRVQELEQVRGREPAGGRPRGVVDGEIGAGDEAYQRPVVKSRSHGDEGPAQGPRSVLRNNRVW